MKLTMRWSLCFVALTFSLRQSFQLQWNSWATLQFHTRCWWAAIFLRTLKFRFELCVSKSFAEYSKRNATRMIGIFVINKHKNSWTQRSVNQEWFRFCTSIVKKCVAFKAFCADCDLGIAKKVLNKWPSNTTILCNINTVTRFDFSRSSD